MDGLICWNCDKERIYNPRTHLCKGCTDLIEKKNEEDHIRRAQNE